tara:strand:- start:139 stop:447 length:309 start_codon:yes stop_codon:yes gene_type:complete
MRRDPKPQSFNAAPSGFKSFKVLWAALIGSGIGVILTIFLGIFIRNTPAEIPRNRLLYLRGVVIASAMLFGSSIESIRQLQECSPEEEYRSQKTTWRGQRRR